MVHTATHPMGDFSLVPAAAMSTLVVFGLFLAMQAMISVDLGEPAEVFTFQEINIFQEPPPPPPPPEPPVKPNEPMEPPPVIQNQTMVNETGGLIVEFKPAVVDPGAAEGGIDLVGATPYPLGLVQPNYPIRALDMGLSGYCVVSFTITAIGATKDVVAQECSNNIFASASIRAAERMKYPPRSVGGRANEVEYQYRFTFEIGE